MNKQPDSPSAKEFSLLIKPASADCNLRCSYCFYLEKARLYPGSKLHRMSDEVLERMISTYMRTKQPVYAFGWQGGEPTLMGLDFFRRAVALQSRFGTQGTRVSNGLQTNGTLLTDEMAAFFTQYNFLLGVSLDGPEDIHNIYRRNVAGDGSFKSVMKGIRCLRRNKTEFNILTLVSSSNKDKAKEVYRFLKSEGIFYHQYIPCVEWDEDGRSLPWSLTGKDWGRFLLDIFSLWYPGDIRTVSIRHFDSIINFLVNGAYNVCHMGGRCNLYYVVEHSGDIYPCDFFVREDLKLGNIMTDSWSSMAASTVYRTFGSAKNKWHPVCSDCEFLPFCSGDCLKHRQQWGGGQSTLSVLCEGWKMFYRETLPYFRELARSLLKTTPPVGDDLLPKRSPEDMCYCGSGRQFKNCHGASEHS